MSVSSGATFTTGLSSHAQVHDALSHYYDHTEQINERIAKLTRPEDTAHRYPATRTPDDADPDISQ